MNICINCKVFGEAEKEFDVKDIALRIKFLKYQIFTLFAFQNNWYIDYQFLKFIIYFYR